MTPVLLTIDVFFVNIQFMNTVYFFIVDFFPYRSPTLTPTNRSPTKESWNSLVTAIWRTPSRNWTTPKSTAEEFASSKTRKVPDDPDLVLEAVRNPQGVDLDQDPTPKRTTNPDLAVPTTGIKLLARTIPRDVHRPFCRCLCMYIVRPQKTYKLLLWINSRQDSFHTTKSVF